jgi:hypothetical protein
MRRPSGGIWGVSWFAHFVFLSGTTGRAIAFDALDVNAVVVVPLVHRARLGAVAARVELVEKRNDVQGFVPASCLNLPCERESSLCADGEVELVPVEAAWVSGESPRSGTPRMA